MSTTTIGFSASFLLGQVHMRIAMALEKNKFKETIDEIKKLKADLDRDISQLYYSNSHEQAE